VSSNMEKRETLCLEANMFDPSAKEVRIGLSKGALTYTNPSDLLNSILSNHSQLNAIMTPEILPGLANKLRERCLS
jgi:hypothetical protein